MNRPEDESYVNKWSGMPRLTQKFDTGIGSVTCVKCQTSFSITRDKKKRPKHFHFECPFCHGKIFDEHP